MSVLPWKEVVVPTYYMYTCAILLLLPPLSPSFPPSLHMRNHTSIILCSLKVSRSPSSEFVCCSYKFKKKTLPYSSSPDQNEEDYQNRLGLYWTVKCWKEALHSGTRKCSTMPLLDLSFSLPVFCFPSIPCLEKVPKKKDVTIKISLFREKDWQETILFFWLFSTSCLCRELSE